eukprot:SAG31_NODE_38148_length_298_cov_1.286432_1_plen_75_part_01
MVQCDEESGCLELIDGSHLHGLLPFEDGSIPEDGLPSGARVPAVLPAFGACLLTQLTAHRSHDNASHRCRWSLDI